MNKIIEVIIKVKVKSFDSVPALVNEVSRCMELENDKGLLEKEDGDKIEWHTTIK